MNQAIVPFLIIVALFAGCGIIVTKATNHSIEYSKECRAKGGVPYMGAYQKARCIRKDAIIDMSEVE